MCLCDEHLKPILYVLFILFHSGWHEELPRARERVDAVLPRRQPRPPLDARLRADAQEVREERQEGPRHRRLQGGLLQGEE